MSERLKFGHVLRSAGFRLTVSSAFQAVQMGLGVSVTPSHFYFPVPCFKSFHGKNWNACRPLTAIDLHFHDQIERLQTEVLPYADEWSFPEAGEDDRHFHFNNGFFERIDAEIAYSFVRHHRSKRVIEIGSGNSTLVLAAALEKNASEGCPGELISVEPHPAPFLKDGLPGLTQLLEVPVQRVPVDLFRTLRAGDILFIDSSHVVSIDSDVLFEFLRILPELASGVIVHFHDIFTPLDYPKKFVMKNLCFWGEQYMLEAFLCFNSAFRVLWSSSAMQQFHSDVLRQAFPAWEGSFTRMPRAVKGFVPSLDGKNVWPCSFWVTRS